MDLGGGSWAGFFASIDCLEDVCGDIDDTLLEALNPSGSCAPREDQAHLLAMGGFSPNQSFRLDDPFFGFQDAPGDDEVCALHLLGLIPILVASLLSCAPHSEGVNLRSCF